MDRMGCKPIFPFLINTMLTVETKKDWPINGALKDVKC